MLADSNDDYNNDEYGHDGRYSHHSSDFNRNREDSSDGPGRQDMHHQDYAGRGPGGNYNEKFENSRYGGRGGRLGGAGSESRNHDDRKTYMPDSKRGQYGDGDDGLNRRNDDIRWTGGNGMPMPGRGDRGMMSRPPPTHKPGQQLDAEQFPFERRVGFPPSHNSSTSTGTGDHTRVQGRNLSDPLTSMSPPNEFPRYTEEPAIHRPIGMIKEEHQQPAPLIPDWNSQPEKREKAAHVTPGRFPISSDGRDVGMGYSVQYHSQDSQDMTRLPGIGSAKKNEPDQRYLTSHSSDRTAGEIRDRRSNERFAHEQHQGNRLNLEPNSAAGMNPPAPDAGPSSNPGTGPGEPNSGPDYAALLQYLQYYQKQMGNQQIGK